jgi:hypothetical protein
METRSSLQPADSWKTAARRRAMALRQGEPVTLPVARCFYCFFWRQERHFPA